jgi:hypothetical protein
MHSYENRIQIRALALILHHTLSAAVLLLRPLADRERGGEKERKR